MSETYTIDWQTKDQSPEEYLHIKEFTDFEKAKSFLQKLRADEDVVYIEKDAICVHDEAGRFVRYEEVPIEDLQLIKTTPNCIDNFNVIDNFLQFEQGSFYKFELLVRNTDGNSPLYKEGYSNTNKNILIKSWYIDTKEYYEKIKHEMKTLADLTGARLYVTLDRKNNFKLIQNLSHAFLDLLAGFTTITKPTIKKIYKTFASETSKKEASEHNFKTLMWDVDTTNEVIVDSVLDYIESKGQKPYILKTKKGYHIFCFRKFNHTDWQDKCCEFICDDPDMTSRDEVISYHEMLCEMVSVKENELGLVYHPMKNFD